MTRVYDAPRDAVFDDWIRPERLARWWTSQELPSGRRPTGAPALRPGDVFRFVVRGPDGNSYCLRVAFREIVAPERVVFAWSNDRLETETVVTAHFVDDAGSTRLEVHQAIVGHAAVA